MWASAMRHPARMATEVPISTCCPIPTGPFGGLEIIAAVHKSERLVAFKIRSASAFKFKIDGLTAARSALPGLIAAAYSVLQGRYQLWAV
jgi:hypothetical protein